MTKDDYKIIAEVIRDEAKRYTDTREGLDAIRTLYNLAHCLAQRFLAECDTFKPEAFMEKCGFNSKIKSFKKICLYCKKLSTFDSENYCKKCEAWNG